LNDLKAKAATVIVATDGNDIQGWDKDDWGNTLGADKALSNVTHLVTMSRMCCRRQ